jgi:hypothetical protein
VNADPLDSVIHVLPGEVKGFGVVVLHPQFSAAQTERFVKTSSPIFYMNVSTQTRPKFHSFAALTAWLCSKRKDTGTYTVNPFRAFFRDGPAGKRQLGGKKCAENVGSTAQGGPRGNDFIPAQNFSRRLRVESVFLL